MNRDTRHEHGQSTIVIALGLAVLMAFMALAVDGGNVYAQRRQVQNAVDAASYAGAEALAHPDPNNNNGRATNGTVWGKIQKYASQNGLDAYNTTTPRLHAWYVTRNSSNVDIIETALEVKNYGTGSNAPLTINNRPVVGVYVSADKDFNSFFAGIVGIRTMTVGAPATSFGAPIAVQPPAVATPPITANGACCADDLFPVAISRDTFRDESNPADGIKDIHFEESDSTYEYQVYEKTSTGATVSNNFYYLQWTGNTNSLSTNMADVTQSGTVYGGDTVPLASGDMTSSSIFNALNTARNASNPYLIVPIYNNGTTPTSNVSVLGFARMKIIGVCKYGSLQGTCRTALPSSSSGRYLTVKFSQWSSSKCEGSCPNYGITSTKEHPPLTQTRSLSGVVKVKQLIPVGTVTNQHIPVDVIHVLDVSGSMDYCVGTTTSCSNTDSRQKLKFAKSALINFNSVISPTASPPDRVGLATFPQITSGSSYSYSCTQSNNTSSYYIGQNRIGLTTNTGSVNSTINGLSATGGTPLAGGLLVGRQMVLASPHDSQHTAVLVVASDGIANIRTNGRWTGFSGTTYSAPTCNNPAVQDAVDQANIAKSDANGDGKPDIIIYSIAIGSDFNSDALRAIASQPTDQHFYTANDAASMASIYNQIAQNIQSSNCTPNELEGFAPNITVRVRNQDTGQTLTTTSTSTGFFEFNNIDPGTYEFQSMSVTLGSYAYDIYTEGVGGPDLTSLPTIEIGTGSGAYEKNLSLRTDDFSCSAP